MLGGLFSVLTPWDDNDVSDVSSRYFAADPLGSECRYGLVRGVANPPCGIQNFYVGHTYENPQSVQAAGSFGGVCAVAVIRTIGVRSGVTPL